MAKEPSVIDPEHPLGRPTNQTLEPEDRKRLSGAGLRTFLAIADLWGLDDEARCRVLGIPRLKTFKRCCVRARSQLPLMLDTAVLDRISNILQIYAGLVVLFRDPREALGWLSRPHDALPFDGQAPKELLTNGDFEDLMAVRRFLDAACSGLYMPPLAIDGEVPPYDDGEIELQAGS